MRPRPPHRILVAQDTSGNDHDGTLTRAGWTATGYRNGALDLNGSGLVSVTDHVDLDLGSAMTLEAWVRPRSDEAWQTVVMKEAPPSTEAYALYATGSGRSNANAWVGPNGMDPPGNTPINKWTHLAFTLKDGVGRLYRDGELVSATPGLGSAVSTGGALRIGGNTIWPDEGFVGLIDEVRVWDVALSASDISDRVPGAGGAPRSAKRAPACLVQSQSGRHRVKRGRCATR